MKLTPVYVITDAYGNAELEVEGTLEQTVEAALSSYGKHTQIVFSGDLEQMKKEKRHEHTVQERLSNPPPLPGVQEAKAMKMLGPNFWYEGRKATDTKPAEPARPRIYGRDEIEALFPMTPQGLRAAHEALRPFFPHKGDFLRVVKSPKSKLFGKEVYVGDTYETAAGMSRSFIVANAKTLKAVEGIAQRAESEDDDGIEVTYNSKISPSLSKGLAFLPYTLAKRTDYYPQWGGVPYLKGNGVCVGSSEACRTSCLVFAGQNQAVEHNNIIKGDRLLGFLNQPMAFIRMMVDSMMRHVKACAKTGTTPYFRPNILSDIPWELLYPELWSYREFENLSIYDYTKLAGRETDSLGNMSSAKGCDPMLDGALRYDLTFSFSGENGEIMSEEMRRGRRLAIVFLRTLKSGSLMASKKTGKVNFKAAESFANMRFLDAKIIDGDEHDLRPLDPQKGPDGRGAVVGLRFKSLRGKDAGSREVQIARAGEFVVGSKGDLPKFEERKRVNLYGEGRTVKYVVQGFEDGHGNLIAPGTPQQEGVPQSTLFEHG